jgi:sugar phosphate permease
MAGQVKTPWGYRHFIVFVLWFLYLVNCFDRISVLTFLPYIQKDLNLSPVQLGWLASIFFFVYAIAQVVAGFLTDRIGPKKTMTIAIWVFTLLTGVIGFVRTFWQFMWLRVGLALGEGQHWSAALRMLANWFPREEQSRANGFFISCVTIAAAVVPIIVTQLAAILGGWRPVFFVLAVPGVIGIVLLWKYIVDTPKGLLHSRVKEAEYNLITSSSSSASGPGASERAGSASLKIVLTDVHFYFYCVGVFFMLMLYWGMAAWISTFLVRQHNLNVKTMGFVASIPYFTAFISMNLGGVIADKWSFGKPKLVSMISFLGCIPAMYMIGRVPKGHMLMLILCLIAGGFFIHLMFGPMYSYPARRYPKEVVGRACGISNGFGQLGSFVSPLIAGYLVVTLPDKSYDFGNVFIFLSLLGVLGILAIAFLKEGYILDSEKYRSQAAASCK